ncbi:SPOR domain-containing protein [Pseudoxanthomonas sp. Soil82]|uniref:SPOR domain-containing protein n=1 Tax=Pseudoxanthomonas sp. Soil82 TaxID=3157341 RepID=UPI00338F24BC
MDTQLKQRLIGGAVLVALAVIFLPMLVQGPAPDSGVANVSTRVTDAPAEGFETRELPLAGPAAATPAGPKALPATAPATTAAAAASPAGPAASPDPAIAAGQWAVSFGAYASARDADAVLQRLRQAGLEGFREEASINGRQAWRVRVGPYADRALAEAGRLQAVRIRSDVNAQVIALDAGKDAAASAPAAAEPAASPAPAAAAPAASQATAAASPAATRTESLPADAPTPRPAAATPATPATPAPKPAAPAAAAPAAAAKAEPAAPAPAASGVGFAVQMGAFASTAEANALRDRLRAAGFSAIVQPVRTDKGTLNRVRVGPVSTRAEADQLKARLASGFGAGMVVPHP